jgi:hypothetical protein
MGSPRNTASSFGDEERESSRFFESKKGSPTNSGSVFVPSEIFRQRCTIPIFSSTSSQVGIRAGVEGESCRVDMGLRLLALLPLNSPLAFRTGVVCLWVRPGVCGGVAGYWFGDEYVPERLRSDTDDVALGVGGVFSLLRFGVAIRGGVRGALVGFCWGEFSSSGVCKTVGFHTTVGGCGQEKYTGGVGWRLKGVAQRFAASSVFVFSGVVTSVAGGDDGPESVPGKDCDW